MIDSFVRIFSLRKQAYVRASYMTLVSFRPFRKKCGQLARIFWANGYCAKYVATLFAAEFHCRVAPLYLPKSHHIYTSGNH